MTCHYKRKRDFGGENDLSQKEKVRNDLSICRLSPQIMELVANNIVMNFLLPPMLGFIMMTYMVKRLSILATKVSSL
jgi:hypothetical protein